MVGADDLEMSTVFTPAHPYFPVDFFFMSTLPVNGPDMHNLAQITGAGCQYQILVPSLGYCALPLSSAYLSLAPL